MQRTGRRGPTSPPVDGRANGGEELTEGLARHLQDVQQQRNVIRGQVAQSLEGPAEHHDLTLGKQGIAQVLEALGGKAPVVVVVVARHGRGNRQQDGAARLEDPGQLGHHGSRVGHVLQHLEGDQCVDRVVGEGEHGGIRGEVDVVQDPQVGGQIARVTVGLEPPHQGTADIYDQRVCAKSGQVGLDVVVAPHDGVVLSVLTEGRYHAGSQTPRFCGHLTPPVSDPRPARWRACEKE